MIPIDGTNPEHVTGKLIFKLRDNGMVDSSTTFGSADTLDVYIDDGDATNNAARSV